MGVHIVDSIIGISNLTATKFSLNSCTVTVYTVHCQPFIMCWIIIQSTLISKSVSRCWKSNMLALRGEKGSRVEGRQAYTNLLLRRKKSFFET